MTARTSWATFGTACSNCGESIIVQSDCRSTGMRCDDCGTVNGPWPTDITAIELPSSDSSERDLIRFSDMFDPLPYFQQLWGKSYSTQINELWERCIASYEEKRKPSDDWRTLLMCLRYGIVIGGDISTGSKKRSFLQWLCNEIRNALTSSMK